MSKTNPKGKEKQGHTEGVAADPKNGSGKFPGSLYKVELC